METAINELNSLQIRLDNMARQSAAVHAEVVERMAQDKPEMMQHYLSAFTKAVGQGEV